ncbi:ankyrin repeat domain-containing protein [Vibrio hannami]|uniref:ankyrin repeat domain-containing protein n=1 Tax=Vibrio hannami TaxID=2717094 RepID=UPI00240FBA3A|nr:ankyrin repeat domain-containing protein [Vibrio hannami]MDG3085551.1 ankyrin repeat domain-containing protein [Vibrio hannami]
MMLPRLHTLIIENDYKEFDKAIAGNADCNQLDPVMGNSPLHIAAQQSSTRWLLRLIEGGAFVNLQTPKHGATPLMIAVWHRKPEMVRELLKQQDINTEIVSTFGLKAEQLVDFGASEDDVYAQEQVEEINGYFAEYRKRLEAKQGMLRAFSITADEALNDKEKASQIASMAVFESINQPSDVTCSGNDEHTAVMVAARDGLNMTLDTLMKLGGDQTIPDHYMKAIPLHKAAYNGHAQIIEILSEYSGFCEALNAQGPNNGYTPLHDAVWHGHKLAVEKLIAAGARTDLRGYDGKTPLDLAKEYHYQSIIKLLETSSGD